MASKVARERNVALRADWALRLTNWSADQLVFIDESAGNERTGYRKYVWAPIGSPSYSIESVKRSKRWSILSVFSIDGYIAHRIHHGSITAEIFNDFIRYDVLPLCSSDGIGSRSAIVMDNARIHRNAELQIMCAEANVLLVYLPLYSSDFNLIEISFAILKAWVKRNIDLAASYTEAMGGFGAFLEDAVVTVQQEYLTAKGGKGDSGNLFRLAGIEYS